MDSQTAFAVDFNLQQVPAAQGLTVPPAAAGPMLGVTAEEFVAYTEELQAGLTSLAAGMLQRGPIRRGLDALGRLLPEGGKILAVGDSITTYRRGYVELLRAMLSQRFGAAAPALVNAGQSGYTSTHALEMVYTQLLALQPHLVIILFGVNDCKHFGSPDARTLVSESEYAQNLAAMVDAFLAHTRARVLLCTPTPVVEAIVNNLPQFTAMRMTWRNDDLAARAAAIRSLAARRGLPLVDLLAAFGPDPSPGLYLPDGLHPNPEGQALMLARLLETLLEWRKE